MADKEREYVLGPTIAHKRKEITEHVETTSIYGSKIYEVRGTGKFELQPCKPEELFK